MYRYQTIANIYTYQRSSFAQKKEQRQSRRYPEQYNLITHILQVYKYTSAITKLTTPCPDSCTSPVALKNDNICNGHIADIRLHTNASHCHSKDRINSFRLSILACMTIRCIVSSVLSSLFVVVESVVCLIEMRDVSSGFVS